MWLLQPGTDGGLALGMGVARILLRWGVRGREN